MNTQRLNEKSTDSQRLTIISFSQLLKTRLPKAFLFFYHIYEDFRTYQKLKNANQFYAAVTLFYHLVGRLIQSERAEIQINKEDWEKLQELYQGDNTKAFLTHIEDYLEIPFVVSIYDAKIIHRTVEFGNIAVVYTQGSGASPWRYENWNEVWIYLQQQANPLLFRLENQIQQILEDNLLKLISDADKSTKKKSAKDKSTKKNNGGTDSEQKH